MLLPCCLRRWCSSCAWYSSCPGICHSRGARYAHGAHHAHSARYAHGAGYAHGARYSHGAHHAHSALHAHSACRARREIFSCKPLARKFDLDYYRKGCTLCGTWYRITRQLNSGKFLRSKPCSPYSIMMSEIINRLRIAC